MKNIVAPGKVHVHIKNYIATIEFSHTSHNMLPTQTMADLANTITAVGNNDAVNVIVLKSGGNRTFSAGASFEELVEIKTAKEGHEFFIGLAKIINACKICPKLIIGRVQGKAVGAGVGIAAAVDYCFATQYASIKLSELALGFGPFVVGLPVEQKVGKSAYAQLALDATTWHTAKWACEKGLYTKVFDSTEDMDVEVALFAEQLSKSNPEAGRLIKEVIWEGTDHWETTLSDRAAISGRLVLSTYTVEAIAAIKGKPSNS